MACHLGLITLTAICDARADGNAWMTSKEAEWLAAAMSQHVQDITGKPAMRDKDGKWTWD